MIIQIMYWQRNFFVHEHNEPDAVNPGRVPIIVIPMVFITIALYDL